MQCGNERDEQRQRRGRDERRDRVQIHPTPIVVGTGGIFGVQRGDVDLAAANQPVVGDDDAEQRAEQGTEAAKEVVDDDRAVVQIPRQDDQADDGADQSGAGEVEPLGEQVGQRIDGATKLAMRLASHRTVAEGFGTV